MKDPDCSSTAATGAQTNVAVGASSPFAITASETISPGYVVNMCYRCEIKPTGQPSIFFDQLVDVTALALDCATSLTPDATFANPPDIAYNSGGTTTSIAVAANYEEIFTHVNKNDCPLTSCEIFDTDCSATTLVSAQSDVILGSTPYGLTASEVNSSGYTLTLCFKCTIQPVGLPAETFTKQITVTATPLDCTPSMTAVGFTNPPASIPYNSAATVPKTIAASYSSIWTWT